MATIPNQSQIKDKAKEVASNVADTTSSLADKARDVGNMAADKARDVGNKAVEKTDDALGSVAGGLKHAATSLRDTVPDKGVVHNAAEPVANALESSGRYLEEKGLAGIGTDVTELIRRNPIPALLLAVGVGYLLASATRSR